jgi:hypothetical protein
VIVTGKAIADKGGRDRRKLGILRARAACEIGTAGWFPRLWRRAKHAS